jgi:hypothetical protein
MFLRPARNRMTTVMTRKLKGFDRVIKTVEEKQQKLL